MTKRQCEIVASRKVDVAYYRGVGTQRGRGFGALPQVIGRTAITFLRKYIVPATLRIGADKFEFAVPEIAIFIIGKINIKSTAKDVGRQTLHKQLSGGSRKRSASTVIPTKSSKRSNRSRKDIFTNVATGL